jgi:O-antigen ligase
LKSPFVLASLDDPVSPSGLSRRILALAVFYGTVGLLLFEPLAFGGVEPWSIYVLEVGAAILLAVWAVQQVIAEEMELTWNRLFPPMLCFAGLIGFQIVTGHTAYAYVTKSQGLLYCSFGMVCFLVVQQLRESRQLKILAWLFSAYGFVVAMFALIQGLSANGKIYWTWAPQAGGWIYGPYVNHNHYAGLMEMLVPIPLVVSLFHYVPNFRRALAAGAAAVMAGTIFLSGSRGGMLAVAVQMAVLFGILARQRKGLKLGLAIAFFLILVMGMLAWLGGGALSSRLASLRTSAHPELSEGLRLRVDRDGLRMFERKPILGWGWGVFPTVYPKYRSFYTNVFVNQAHNDYLQLLIEAGGIGFVLMLWFIVTTYYQATRKLENWARDPNGAVALVAIIGITGILVHSLVDFNLQIPANAALFYVLCVVGALEPRFASLSRHRPRKHRSAFEDRLSA